jgi:hypothetical protein
MQSLNQRRRAIQEKIEQFDLQFVIYSGYVHGSRGDDKPLTLVRAMDLLRIYGLTKDRCLLINSDDYKWIRGRFKEVLFNRIELGPMTSGLYLENLEEQIENFLNRN